MSSSITTERFDDSYEADAFAGAANAGSSVPEPFEGSSVPRHRGITKTAPSTAKGWGRGPVQPDMRKYRYDVLRAVGSKPVSFSVSKEDRMDAVQAGEMLHRLHVELGIDKAEENRIHAFNQALFFQHTINGASVLQKGQGSLVVDGHSFDLAGILRVLGSNARRFFRAFADDIAEVNRAVLAGISSYDPESLDKYGQLMQVATERGLHKYPYLAHDSADACLTLSLEERRAVIASKRHVLMTGRNAVDVPFDVQEDAAHGQSLAV